MGDKVLLPGWFEGLGALAGSQGQAERAGRLYGAAAALRDAVGSPLSRAERIDVEEAIGRYRAEIGDEAWGRAWEAGRALSLEQAVAEALEDNARG
jgi:hypothetical protein